jgi:hypothetical protein
MRWYPWTWSAGANGWMRPNSGQLTGIISVVALSFMVHDPRGIMLVLSERSFTSSEWMYRSISVSE